MKIGFDAKRIFHNTTGLGNYSRDLVKILSDFYPQNSYFLYNPKPKKVHRLQLAENMTEVMPTTKIWKTFSSIWRQQPIVNQIKQDQIDIFHGLTGEIPIGLTKQNVKTVVTIHDLIFVRYPKLYSFFDRKIHFQKFKYAAKNADKVIAISHQTKKDIIEFLKIDEHKIEVVYQGCHSAFKENQTTDFIKKVLQKYNLPSQFILNVGTIEERKNVLTLIKATKNIDIPIVVVGGKTNYFKKVKAYVDNHKISNKIFFLQGLNLQELAALYKTAILFVYPSIFEGFGIPIIEAIYSKTPVITSKEGVFPEAGGEYSRYVNPLDVEELESEIVQLLQNPSQMQEMASNGYDFVQKFNDQSIANNIMNIYKNLI